MNQVNLLDWAKGFWQLLVGVVLSLMALAYVAYGATYNFYFNNTEQGPNSTASPNVTVTDGGVTGAENKSMMGPKKPEAEAAQAEAAKAEAEPSTPAPAPATAAPATASSVATVAIEPESPHKTSHLRLLVGGGFVAPRETIDVPSYDNGYGSYGGYSYRSHKMHAGAKVELGFFGTRDLGVNFFAGGFASTTEKAKGFGGAELELQPIHISIGKAYDLINFGVMLGATTLGKVDDNWVAAHGGARLQFNVGDGWGLAVTGRGNLGFLAADASLVIRM